MTACVASEARTPLRSIASGNATRCHVRPSVDRATVPASPTIQHTVGDGAVPEESTARTPLDCACQFAPASTLRWTLVPLIRQRTFGSGEAISIAAAGAAFAAVCMVDRATVESSAARGAAGASRRDSTSDDFAWASAAAAPEASADDLSTYVSVDAAGGAGPAASRRSFDDATGCRRSRAADERPGGAWSARPAGAAAPGAAFSGGATVIAGRAGAGNAGVCATCDAGLVNGATGG